MLARVRSVSGEGGTLPGVDLDHRAALYGLMDGER